MNRMTSLLLLFLTPLSSSWALSNREIASAVIAASRHPSSEISKRGHFVNEEQSVKIFSPLVWPASLLVTGLTMVRDVKRASFLVSFLTDEFGATSHYLMTCWTNVLPSSTDGFPSKSENRYRLYLYNCTQEFVSGQHSKMASKDNGTNPMFEGDLIEDPDPIASAVEVEFHSNQQVTVVGPLDFETERKLLDRAAEQASEVSHAFSLPR